MGKIITIAHATMDAGSNWIKRYSVPLTVFAISRFGLFILAYLSLILIPISNEEAVWRAFPDNFFLDGWVRWDAGWYVSIAQDGYTNLPRNEWGQADTVFFPFYPLLIRVFTLMFRDPFLSGMVISNLSFLVALLLLYQLLRDQYGEEIAERSIVLLAVNPFSFYFSAVYSESVFLLAVVAAFYFGERKQWLWAGLSAAVAGATRVVGVLTMVGLLLLYLEQISFQWQKIRPNILWIGVGLIGPGSYMVFLATRFGNAFQFVESQYVAGWGEGVSTISAVETIRALSFRVLVSGTYPAMDVIHLCIFIIAVVMLVFNRHRLGAAYIVWGLSMLVGSFTLWRGMGRYAAVIFPLYVVISLVLSEWQYRSLLYISTLLLALLTIVYTHFYWVS